MKLGPGLLSAVLLSGIAVGALAHGGATGIVKERMDGMSAMAKVMKTLTPIMKGQAEFDAAAIASGAGILSRHAGTSMTSRFPQGSAGMPSEAAEEIWTDWEDFEALAMQLEQFAMALELSAGRDRTGTAKIGGDIEPAVQKLAEMPPQKLFGMIGKTCSACHKRFRVEAE